MSVYLSPIGNAFQFLTPGGLPLDGGQIATYAAGTTTPQATYTDATGGTANANPIILNTDGRTPNEVWLSSGLAYKFVLMDSLSNVIATYDNLTGINDISATNIQVEWVVGPAATYLSATQFTLAGNQLPNFQQGRRIQVNQTGGVYYGTITASAYTNLTTVTVQMDSTPLNSGLTTVNYAFLNAVAPSSPHLSGEVKMWPGSALPPQHLWCDGASYSAAQYPGLYAVLGTVYGATGGSGTFNVPNLKGRSPIGVGSAGQTNNYTLGQNFGEELHALATGELAAHTHASGGITASDSGHVHQQMVSQSGSADVNAYLDSGGTGTSAQMNASSSGYTPSSTQQNTASAASNLSVSGSTASVGSNTGHNTVHPVLAINYIIAV